MSSVNNAEHNRRLIKRIQENNKNISKVKDRELEIQQGEILKDALKSLDERPAVNKTEGDIRVAEIRKFHLGLR